MNGDTTLWADAHIHLFRDGYQGRYGRSPAGGDELENYEGIRAVHQVSKALVVGYEGQAQYRGNNSYLSSLVATREWIAPLAYRPPAPHPSIEQLRGLWRQRFVGISLYLMERAAGAAWSAWPDLTWTELNSRHAIVSLNCLPAAATAAAPAIERLGDCSVLLSHLGLPGPVGSLHTEELRQLLRPALRLSRFPHVGVKLSGLYAMSEPPHGYPFPAADAVAESMLEAYGPARVYWGSDYPCCLDDVSFPQTLDLAILRQLDANERRAVAGGNLLRVLELAKG